jgi:hypothetical protein
MTGAIDQEIRSLLSVSAINQKDGMKTRNPFFEAESGEGAAPL